MYFRPESIVSQEKDGIEMDKRQFLEQVAALKIIPVFRAESAEQVDFITESLIENGLPIIEITLTVPGAIQSIEAIKKKYQQEIIVGAGTVLDSETARMAILSGAEFIVAPVVHTSVITMAHRYGKACIMGALTPTEVLQAWESGSDVVKVYPCDAMGGPDYIRTLKSSLPQVELTPSRGTNDKNMTDYLESGAIAVSVGPNLLKPGLIKERSTRELAAIIQHYVKVGNSFGL